MQAAARGGRGCPRNRHRGKTRSTAGAAVVNKGSTASGHKPEQKRNEHRKKTRTHAPRQPKINRTHHARQTLPLTVPSTTIVRKRPLRLTRSGHNTRPTAGEGHTERPRPPTRRGAGKRTSKHILKHLHSDPGSERVRKRVAGDGNGESAASTENRARRRGAEPREEKGCGTAPVTGDGRTGHRAGART